MIIEPIRIRDEGESRKKSTHGILHGKEGQNLFQEKSIGVVGWHCSLMML